MSDGGSVLNDKERKAIGEQITDMRSALTDLEMIVMGNPKLNVLPMRDLLDDLVMLVSRAKWGFYGFVIYNILRDTGLMLLAGNILRAGGGQ